MKKPTDVPQLAIIFNNASGMRYTLLENAKTVAAFDEHWRIYGVSQDEVNYMYRQPNRSTASKKSVAQLIDRIPSAVDIGLVELKSCLSIQQARRLRRIMVFLPVVSVGHLKAKLKGMNVRENQSCRERRFMKGYKRR